MPTSAGHTIVVGGGIFGAVAALELKRRDWDVTVVDPGPLPHERASSTDVSKVIRMDYGSDVFYLELGEAAFEGWDAWNREWGTPRYHEDGFLLLSGSPMAAGGFEHESFVALTARGHEPIRLTELREDPARAPALSRWRLDAYPDGYFNPRAGWAESGAVVGLLLAEAARRGVRMVEASFRRVVEDGSRVSGVETDAGDHLDADRVVVAAGAWTPTLLPWLSDVLWATGQPVLHFQVDDPARFRAPAFAPWAADIANSGWYGFPSLVDGRVKVANHGEGRRVHPDRPGTVPDEHVERTRTFLRGAIPELAERPVVYRRVCMYCDSFDGDFFIGADPDREGLVVAAGGSGHGFKFAPVLGGVIADAVEGRENRWSQRFGWRSLGATRHEEARHMGQS